MLLSVRLHNLPKHIAIIMDGNGRWGKLKYNNRNLGHSNSISSINMVIKECIRLEIPYLTLYAFSKENWERPKKEVDFIIALMHDTIKNKLMSLDENNVKLSFIGDIGDFPNSLQGIIAEAVDKTKNNVGLNLSIALSYSGRWEILDAVKKIILSGLNPEQIDENSFNNFMQSKNIFNPDLLIRTGGEKRLSNFFLWQLAYTEIFFSDTLWPEFSLSEFREAILFYQKRDRRFGKLNSNYNEASN
jgi:undecaprenyl diphosphate synthase